MVIRNEVKFVKYIQKPDVTIIKIRKIMLIIGFSILRLIILKKSKSLFGRKPIMKQRMKIKMVIIMVQ